MFVVYKITSKNSGKVYIGSSRNVKSRWYEHKRLGFAPIERLRDYDFDSINPITKRKKIGNIRERSGLYLEMRVGKEEDFIFEIIEECSSKEIMLVRENYYICNNWDNSYNNFWTENNGKTHSRITKITSKQWVIYRKLEKEYLQCKEN